jgi:sterol desaturase/sphingolipid hydroxylase (fatty acid hydroxylase superfamily)
VEGGPFKRLFFTWFQPTVLFALILFWYYAPNSIAKASTAIGIGIGFRVFLMGLEFFFPRHESWKLTWKEVTTDLFYVGLGYTVLRLVDGFIGSDVMVGAQGALHLDNFKWFIGLPIPLQAFIISFIFDFGQYWMHRGMHNWYPLWLPHSVHHYITQLNINKGAVGNPVELFLIGLGGRLLRFRAARVPAGRAIGMAVGSYQHINVRFNSPRWWRFLFHTTEHHSLHHSQDFEASRSNLPIHTSSSTACSAPASMAKPNCWAWKAAAAWELRADDLSFTDAWRTIKAKLARPAAQAVPAE